MFQRSQLNFQAKQLSFVSPKALDSGHELTGLHLTSDWSDNFLRQISLPKQHSQTNYFLFVHSLPHFFMFFSYMYFSLHPHLYFFSHFICNSSFTPYGISARLWCAHISRTKLIIQAHRTPGGQHIFVSWQTTSWVTCSKGWRDTTFKQANSFSSGFGKNSLITHTNTRIFICTDI